MTKKLKGILKLKESRWTFDEICAWALSQNHWLAWEEKDGVFVGRIYRKNGGAPFGDFLETAPSSQVYNYRLYLY